MRPGKSTKNRNRLQEIHDTQAIKTGYLGSSRNAVLNEYSFDINKDMTSSSDNKVSATSNQVTQLVSYHGSTSTNTNNSINMSKTGLPENLKQGVESISGYSMDNVKVHYNSSSPARFRAHAYTKGTDIHIASGQERHLPHEAWHVVQQKQGRVKPTVKAYNNQYVNDDPVLEHEADVMGKQSWLHSKYQTGNSLQEKFSHQSNHGYTDVHQLVPVENEGGGFINNNASLEKQTGGSCWLFVLDAIKTEFTGESLLGTAKHLYPGGSDLEERAKRDGVSKSRELALTMVIEKLNALLPKLDNIQEDSISKSKLEELSRRSMGVEYMHILADNLFVDVDSLTIESIKGSVNNIIVNVNALKNSITDPDKADLKDDEKLLGGDRYDLSGGADVSVKRIKFLFNYTGGKLPMYMYLNTRYTARNVDDMDANEIDWTGRSLDEIESRGRHAVMLVGINYGTTDVENMKSYESFGDGEENGYVIYKDPNYGNIRIKITWKQLQRMMMQQEDDAYFGLSSHE